MIQYKIAVILQMTFSNAFSCAKFIVFRFKFPWGSIDNKSALLHVMARRRQALPERKMTQFADAYIYFTQPQWVMTEFGPDGCRSHIYSSQRSQCVKLRDACRTTYWEASTARPSIPAIELIDEQKGMLIITSWRFPRYEPFVRRTNGCHWISLTKCQ